MSEKMNAKGAIQIGYFREVELAAGMLAIALHDEPFTKPVVKHKNLTKHNN